MPQPDTTEMRFLVLHYRGTERIHCPSAMQNNNMPCEPKIHSQDVLKINLVIKFAK